MARPSWTIDSACRARRGGTSRCPPAGRRLDQARRERALGFLGAGAADHRRVDAEETRPSATSDSSRRSGGAAPCRRPVGGVGVAVREVAREAPTTTSRVDERRAVCTCSPSLVFAVCAKRTRRSGPPRTGSTPTLCGASSRSSGASACRATCPAGGLVDALEQRAGAPARGPSERGLAQHRRLRRRVHVRATHSWIAPSVLAVAPVAPGDISGGSSSSDRVGVLAKQRVQRPEIGFVSVCVMGSELGGFMNVGWQKCGWVARRVRTKARALKRVNAPL